MGTEKISALSVQERIYFKSERSGAGEATKTIINAGVTATKNALEQKEKKKKEKKKKE